jgi:acylphosphatase
MVRLHVYITGRVQGVFFRACTQDQARSLGLVGWVRNLRDGRVEAVFEGEVEKVMEMLKWCHKGPPGAHVSNLEEVWEEKEEGFTTFETRY